MKKSLSLLLALALVISMFAATSASAATNQEEFDALKAAGIVAGYPDGSAGLEKDMTRAEFAKVLANLNGLAEDTAAASIYTDLPASADYWARGFIGAATKAGLVNGIAVNKFSPNGKVTVEQVAKTIVLSLGLGESSSEVTGSVSEWAKGYVAAAINAGLLDKGINYKANASRGLLFHASYIAYQQLTVKAPTAVALDANTIEVTWADGTKENVTLETPLVAGTATTVTVTKDGVSYPVSVTLDVNAVSAKQTNANEITVSFARALTDAEKAAITSYALTQDLVNYTVTPKWADDSKSVVLTSTYMPAGTYTLTLTGYDAFTVTVADEAAAKVEITTNSLQKIDDFDLGVVVTNQFGKEMENPSLNVTVYNTTKGAQIPVTAVDNEEQIDIASDAVSAVDDVVVVTAVVQGTALSASKTFKVVAGSSATSLKFGAVAPLTDKTRISVNEDELIIPYTFADQYGTAITLPDQAMTEVGDDNSITIGGITFIVNDNDIVDSFGVEDGVLMVNTGDTAGTAIINAVNSATGATGSVTFVVANTAVVAKLQMSNPGVVVVEDEVVTIPFVAVDSYNAQIAGADVTVLDTTATTTEKQDNVVLTSSIPFNAGYPRVNGKGQLELSFQASGTAYLYAYVNGASVGTLTLTVKDAATAVKVNGIKDVATNLELRAGSAAAVDFDQDNITYVDTYSRTKNVDAGTYDVSSNNNGIVKFENNQLVAVAEGTATISVSLNNVAGDAAYTFSVKVVPSSDIKSYSISTIGTIYGVDGTTGDLTSASAHAKTVELVGKLSNGSTVALAADTEEFLTISDATLVGKDGMVIFGLEAGTVTVNAWKGGAKVASQDVTVSEAAPVATTVAFNDDEYVGTTTFVINDDTVDNYITVKDQYGVAINPAGRLVSSDTSIATTSGLTVTAVKRGTATITYVAPNGVTGSTTIVVN